MACDLWRTKIEAYADGELPAAEQAAFAAHARSCASCAADALGRVQMKRAIAEAGKRFTPSAEFSRRMEKQLAAKSRRTWLKVWLPGMAVAAAALVLALMIATRWKESRHESTWGELADLHTATLASVAPVDVVSTDRHTVKPWFAGKLPFTFNLPELQGTPFTLLGGRVTYLHQTPGAQLLYQVRQHKISVFIFQDQAGLNFKLNGSDAVSKQLTFNLDTFSAGGLRYFIISDVATDDIRQLSSLLKSAALSN
ncbi:MAG: anti-sigma factor family protein [Candidatus Acidiferrales bacterium]